MGFPFPIQAGGPHTQAAPSMSAVFTHPHGFPHMPEPFSHTFPRLPQSPYACADPHRFSQFPIRFRGSHIQSPGSKNLTLIPTRPAFPAPQIRHPPVSANSLRRLPARYRMSRRNTIPPRPAAGLRKPTRPANSLKFPAPTRGVWRRFATRRRRRSGDLHSSPPERRLLRRGSPGNRSRLGSTKVRRCGVRATGSAGRMTDHAGHQPGPASRLRYAVGVPYLYLFEYLLQCFVDSFQFVVCLFLASLQYAVDSFQYAVDSFQVSVHVI